MYYKPAPAGPPHPHPGAVQGRVGVRGWVEGPVEGSVGCRASFN